MENAMHRWKQQKKDPTAVGPTMARSQRAMLHGGDRRCRGLREPCADWCKKIWSCVWSRGPQRPHWRAIEAIVLRDAEKLRMSATTARAPTRRAWPRPGFTGLEQRMLLGPLITSVTSLAGVAGKRRWGPRPSSFTSCSARNYPVDRRSDFPRLQIT